MKVTLSGMTRPVRWVGRLFGRAGRWTGHLARRHPTPGLVVGAAVLLGSYFAVLWRAPQLIVGSKRLAALDVVARTGAEYNARILVVSAGGAVVVLVGLAYTARTYALNRASTARTYELGLRGQMTDRFTKALERLGSAEMYVRIGGVHALEHVMADSAEHHADVVEVLVAFLRHRAPRRLHTELELPVDPGRWLHPPTEYRRPPAELPAEPEADVQAALTALCRRPPRGEAFRLQLSDLHLTRANLHRANLSLANLNGTNLTRANLTDADLTQARLYDANLTDARLHRVNLTQARLAQANLTSANLTSANLTQAQLGGTHLARTGLTDAYLLGADLSHANLTDANLTDALLVGARGLESAAGPSRVMGELVGRGRPTEGKGTLS